MRRWGWVAAIAVVAVLVVGAFVAGEAVARTIIRDRMQQAVHDAGARAAQLDVDIPGLVIPQLLAGRIDEARVTGHGVEYEGISTDVRLTLEGVDTRAMTARAAAATAALDAAALEALIGRASDGTAWEALGGAAEVAIAEPDVTLSGELPILGALQLALRPSAADGRLLLAPEAIALGDWRLERDDLAQLPPGVPTVLAQPILVCLSDALPRGITLSDATVEGERLIAHLALDGGLLNDPTLREPGDCA